MKIAYEADYSTESINNFIDAMNNYVLTNNEELNKSLEHYYTFINTYTLDNPKNSKVIKNLNTTFKLCALAAKDRDFAAMQRYVLECKTILENAGVRHNPFSLIDLDNKRYAKILKCINQLEKRAAKLETQEQVQQAQNLKDFTKELKNAVFAGILAPPSVRNYVFETCLRICHRGLEQSKDAIKAYRNDLFFCGRTETAKNASDLVKELKVLSHEFLTTKTNFSRY